MIRFVALFRGIDVGGKHSLPMQALREILAACGCVEIRTYIQSGNAIFSAAEPNPKSLHVWFLTQQPSAPNLDALHDLRAESESFSLQDDAFYLYAPEGIGRSRLAAKVDRHLGVTMTARNWRIVSKIIELANNVIT